MSRGNIKNWLRRASLFAIIIALLAPMLSPLQVSAAGENDRQKMRLQMILNAVAHCSSFTAGDIRNSYVVELSTDGFKNEVDKFRNPSALAVFTTKTSSNTYNISGHLYESLHSTFKTESPNGYTACYEYEGIFQDLLTYSGKGWSDVICSGANGGIFDVKLSLRGYENRHTNGGVWHTIDDVEEYIQDIPAWRGKSGKNCKENIDAVMSLTGKLNTRSIDGISYSFRLTLTPIDGSTHLNTLFAPIASTSHTESVRYWHKYETFNSVCKKVTEGILEKSDNSFNYYAIYNPDDGKTRYFLDSDIPDKTVRMDAKINGSETETCRELAADLSSDDAMVIANQEDIDNCIAQWKAILEELRDYWVAKITDNKETAQKIYDTANKLTADNAKTVASETLALLGDADVISLEQKLGKYGGLIGDFSQSPSLYGPTFSTLKEKLNDIAGTESPTENQIGAAQTAIQDVKKAIDKRDKDSRSIQDIIDKYQRYSDDEKWEIDGNGVFTCKDENIKKEIEDLKIEGLTVTTYEPKGHEDEDKSNTLTAEDELAKCFEEAGSMGWILCPVVTTLADLGDTVYEWIEGNYLRVSIDIFGENDSSGLYQAWGVMRSFANIVFIIILLIVIFSQVTGYGIDNFGIKRILPRLIITAILINLSYIFCKFAVDVANILGASLKSLLEGSFGIAGGTASSGASVGASFAVIGGVGLLALVTAFFLNPALIVTVLFALLSAVIALIFLWAILVARQAGVVLLIALSPVAFACYLLPNTERIFKRWVDLAKSLLLLYPICGLVIGGSKLAARILASASGSGEVNGGLALAAMLVQVIPYFFIPTLLKSSLAGLGNIGAKISGLGKAFSRGTVGRAANSEAVKRLRTNVGTLGTSNPKSFRARVAGSRLGRATGVQQSTNRSIAAKEKMFDDDIKNETMLQNRLHPNATIPEIQEDFKRAAAKNDEQGMAVALNRMSSLNPKDTSSFLADEVSKLDVAGNSGDRKKLSAMRSAVSRNDSFQRYFDGKETDASRMLTGNGMDSSGNYQNLTGFTDTFAKTMEMKDLPSLSAGALRRAAATGSFRPELARDVLSSNDPAVMSMLSDPAKKKIIEGIVAADNQAQTQARSAAQAATDAKRRYNAEAMNNLSNQAVPRVLQAQEGQDFNVRGTNNGTNGPSNS